MYVYPRFDASRRWLHSAMISGSWVDRAWPRFAEFPGPPGILHPLWSTGQVCSDECPTTRHCCSRDTSMVVPQCMTRPWLILAYMFQLSIATGFLVLGSVLFHGILTGSIIWLCHMQKPHLRCCTGSSYHVKWVPDLNGHSNLRMAFRRFDSYLFWA